MNDAENAVRYGIMPAIDGLVARMDEYARCKGLSDTELVREWRRARDTNDGLLMQVVEDIQQDRNRGG